MDNKIDERIKKMLDNSILDWNRPSQLTTVEAKANYRSLIPAIKQLFKEEWLRMIGEDELRPLAGPKRNGIDQGLRRTRNKLRAELRKLVEGEK